MLWWWLVLFHQLPLAIGLIIPTLHSVADRISNGETLVARRLNQIWGTSAAGLVWYSPMIGPKYLQPDFVVLDPNDGLVVLEVKEWKADSIQECNPNTWKLRVNDSSITVKNPLRQARDYAEAIHRELERDSELLHPPNHNFAGRLCIPYGYGVVFTNLSRKRHKHILQTIDDKHVICLRDQQHELPWRDCLHYNFGTRLTQLQVDRIRGILFPELVIRRPATTLPLPMSRSPDELISTKHQLQIMDARQELLARSLGSGHRIIHGVSGSGKTLILQCRVKYLTQQTKNATILVLCYNRVLAMKLRHDLERSCPDCKHVHVYHFHQWCRQMLVQYHIPLPTGTSHIGQFAAELYEAVKTGINQGIIPRGQYHSILIDEVHDFAPDWISLLVQQVSPFTESLLLVYDDAQKLYSHHGSKFTFRQVGVDAQGRTNILRTNYRNTQQIIQFAYQFVEPYLRHTDNAEDTTLVPRTVGRSGANPFVFTGTQKEQELYLLGKCIDLLKSGYKASDIAILCKTKDLFANVQASFKQSGLPLNILSDRSSQSGERGLSVVTIHSSKGLEFPIVFIPFIGSTRHLRGQRLTDEARLLYVAMTRATERLFLLKGGERNSVLGDQLDTLYRGTQG